MRPNLEKTLHKNKAGGMAQGEGPEFKPQYRQTNKQTNKYSQAPVAHACNPNYLEDWD
jgi:hypothetical protein